MTAPAQAEGRPEPPKAVRRVLVVGVPRSGTSWVGRILGSTGDASYLEEPDNHEHCPFAFRAKRRLVGRFYPALEPGAEPPEYELLWRAALAVPVGASAAEFTLRERAQRRLALRLLLSASDEEILRAVSRTGSVPLRLRAAEALAIPERPSRLRGALVVKSVHAPLSLEWIASRYRVNVLIVLRNLFNVVSSWQEMNWLGGAGNDMLDEVAPELCEAFAARSGITVPGLKASPLARAAWLFGLLTCSLLEAASRHPDWHVVSHDDLCESPHERFRELSGRLGLQWREACDRLLDEMNRPGRGYETLRLAEELRDVWRSRLSRAQVGEIASVLDAFPLDDWMRRPTATVWANEE